MNDDYTYEKSSLEEDVQQLNTAVSDGSPHHSSCEGQATFSDDEATVTVGPQKQMTQVRFFEETKEEEAPLTVQGCFVRTGGTLEINTPWIKAQLMKDIKAFNPTSVECKFKPRQGSRAGYIDFKINIKGKRDSIAFWQFFYAYDDQTHKMYSRVDLFGSLRHRLTLNKAPQVYEDLAILLNKEKRQARQQQRFKADLDFLIS